MMKAALILFSCLFGGLVLAKSTPGFVGGKRFAKGYDPVSYLSENAAVKGRASRSYTFQGTEFWFSSEPNKQKFIANPEKFIPAYNGWCAYAMAKNGKLVSVNPNKFKVVDGRVFLFYSNIFINTLVRWNESKSENALIQAGDKNWSKHGEP